MHSVDAEIQSHYSAEQIGIGLNLIYSNACTDIPFCYIRVSEESRKVKGIHNLRRLYSNFFEKYCKAPVTSVGNDTGDGKIGYLCYMPWDIFVLYPGNAPPKMIDAGLGVMANALTSVNDNCVVSAIHGLGHWVDDAPQAGEILKNWLRAPTTENEEIHDYARRATTGAIQ